MTSLVAVSAHLPDTVGVASLQERLGLTDVHMRRYERIYGLSRICRSAESEADLLLAAAGKLEGLAGQEDRVRYLVRARTVPFAAPYPASPLARVRAELGLRHAQTFTLSEHACASGLLAVDLCGTLLAADGDPDALALVLVGEKAFTRSVEMIPDVAIMGEGTAAVLVSAGGTQDRLLSYATRSYGRADAAFVMSDEGAAEFRRIYADGLAEVMNAAVAQAGIVLADVDLVLPHNVNRISWTRSAKELGLDPDRILLDNVPETGHCFCADPFINLATAVELGRLRPGDRYLMTSVGLGSTFSAMLFEH
jgi:3-oxoacyl-[acyl-carrier-protein] synthase-3